MRLGVPHMRGDEPEIQNVIIHGHQVFPKCVGNTDFYVSGKATRPEAVVPEVDKIEIPDNLFIPAPDGAIDFGSIGPDIETASKGRFPSASIRLEEGGAYGKSHIAKDRIKEFKANGYNDEIDALSDITQHYTEIYEQPNGRLLLVKRNGRGKFAAVELQNNGGYYGVTTWFLEDAKPKGKTPYEQRGGRKLLLRVAHADDPDQSPSFPASVEEPGQPEGSRRSN
jgi:hypothetical protein